MHTTAREYETVGPDAVDIGAYGCFEMDGGVVVYDREGDSAWIHATASVDLSDAR